MDVAEELEADLDNYCYHTTVATKDVAEELEADLVFIPACCTCTA